MPPCLSLSLETASKGYDEMDIHRIGTIKLVQQRIRDAERGIWNRNRIFNISSASVAKLGKCENITTDVIIRICKGLNCKLEDIMELEEDAAPKHSSAED